MSGITIEIDTDPLGRLDKSLAEYQKKLNRAIARQVIPPLERELDRVIQQRLTVTPPPRTLSSPPFVWSRNPEKNAAARGWFFRNYPNGYKRTGRLPRNWKAITVFQDGAIVFRIENDAPGASYVYGAPEFAFGQVPGHKDWLNAGRVVPDALLDVAVRAQEEIKAILVEVLAK